MINLESQLHDPTRLGVAEPTIGGLDEESSQSIMPLMERCVVKITRLKILFQEVVPHSDTSRMERYRKSGKEKRAETLMAKTTNNVRRLAGHGAIKGATEAQVKELDKTVVNFP